MKLNALKSLLVLSVAAVSVIASAQQTNTGNSGVKQVLAITKGVDLTINYFLNVAFADNNNLATTITDGGISGTYSIGTASYTVFTNFNTNVVATMSDPTVDLAGTGGSWTINQNGYLSFAPNTSAAAQSGTVSIGVSGLSYTSVPKATPYSGTLTLTFTQN